MSRAQQRHRRACPRNRFEHRIAKQHSHRGLDFSGEVVPFWFRHKSFVNRWHRTFPREIPQSGECASLPGDPTAWNAKRTDECGVPDPCLFRRHPCESISLVSASSPNDRRSGNENTTSLKTFGGWAVSEGSARPVQQLLRERPLMSLLTAVQAGPPPWRFLDHPGLYQPCYCISGERGEPLGPVSSFTRRLPYKPCVARARLTPSRDRPDACKGNQHPPSASRFGDLVALRAGTGGVSRSV